MKATRTIRLSTVASRYIGMSFDSKYKSSGILRSLSSPGRLERRKARTRASIITAASKLFHERGYEETSIQHIAELADTGVGTLYGYFSSKDEILREVLQTERDEALDRYFASIDRTTPYMERACMAVLALAAYLRNNRTILTAGDDERARVRVRNIGFDQGNAPLTMKLHWPTGVTYLSHINVAPATWTCSGASTAGRQWQPRMTSAV